MAFVKLDCGILTSTIWYDHEARLIFITALLMAEPRQFDDPLPQIEVDSLSETGWSAPPGWYGFVPAAGTGIISRAGGLSREDGIEALRRLGSPEQESRSQAYEGRRLIRIDGGYLVLNYDKYRERDYTASDRMRRYRERKLCNVTRNSDDVTRNVTQAEERRKKKKESKSKSLSSGRKRPTPPTFPDDSSEMRAARYMFDRVRENVPTMKEPNWQGWARDFDLIFRVDRRPSGDVRKVIDFAAADSFWRRNILSPDKLRKQYDKLTAAQLRDIPPPPQPPRFVA